MLKNNYRPEIDGLRAIAIGAVIIYHADITIFSYELFKGGFIGVDIFFVISGYLITSIIFKELVNTGTFSFKYFYERRVRRILPVLLVVMLVSFPFGFLYLMPSILIDYSKSILYSLGFSSNFYFHYSGQSYGAANALLKPFLHTWSLSVEEQYYILFPLFFIITFKYFRKYLVYILLIGLIVSLILADLGSKNNPSANFYFIHTRMWELIAGSLLAYFETKLGNRSKYRTLNLILPSVGLFLIGYSIIFFNDQMLHPSFYSLLPIIGVSLIIWFSDNDELVTKILSTKLFVGIGLISYSLYLWHYPIFAFARNSALIDGELIKKLLVVIIILSLSITSYFFIEVPSRNKNIKFKSVLSWIVLVVILIFSFSIFIIYKDGKVNKVNTMLEKQITSPLYSSQCKYSSSNANFIDDDFFKTTFKKCKKKFILIIGDSHAIDLFNSIAKNSKEDEHIVGLNKNGCRPNNNKASDCQYLNALKFIKKYKLQIKYVFFTHAGSKYNEDQLKETIEYLNKIKNLVDNLILLGPRLEIGMHLNRVNMINILENNSLIPTKLKKINKDLILLDKKLKKVIKKNNIKYISMIDAIKFDIKNDFLVNSKFTYSDPDHWTAFGELYFGKKLIFNSDIKNILFP
jgi:peptidoglycan/LPS O-acetylase OafA/YrhL